MSGGPDNTTPAAGAPPAAPAADAAPPAAPPSPPVAANPPASDAAPPAAAPTPAADAAASPAPVAQPPAPDAKPADPAAPAADAKPPAAAEPPADKQPTSLLSEPPKPADAAPAADGEKPADAAPPVEPAPLPTYEFKTPEGFEVAPEKMGEFQKLFGEFERSTGGDHVKFGEHGQKLIDFHLAELQRVHEAGEKASREAWETMRDEWRTSFRNDTDLGGPKQQATLSACASVIDQFGGNATQRAELRQWLAVTGMGDHPALIRLLSNVQKVLGEPKIVPAIPPATKPSRASRRYGQTQNGAA